ncbi:uncharacterized protein LOC134236571 isoform X4 [Saccostrea cucullata]|uniref:uncharacterized protein LOC134236571 isoform X4 n=1 Tax=Saccostrea cuccullata TaxID=36930 RepID=UPI002ED07768
MISGTNRAIFFTSFLFIECALSAITTQGGGNCSNCFETFTLRVIADPSNKIFVCSELRTLVTCLKGDSVYCIDDDPIKGSEKFLIFKALADSCQCASGSSEYIPCSSNTQENETTTAWFVTDVVNPTIEPPEGECPAFDRCSATFRANIAADPSNAALVCRIQPNLDTRKKQLEAWCALILDYHRKNKSYSIDITEIQSSPLFYNKKINRKLPLDGIHTVLEELRKQGHIEWTDPKVKKQGLIMWRTPEEWGKLIYSWVTSKSLQNSVCTLYELSEGEDSEGTEFHGLEKWLLLRALQSLQDQGKAELMNFDGNEGVKFF